MAMNGSLFWRLSESLEPKTGERPFCLYLVWMIFQRQLAVSFFDLIIVGCLGDFEDGVVVLAHVSFLITRSRVIVWNRLVLVKECVFFRNGLRLRIDEE